MNLHKSVLETLYTDIQKIEQGLIARVLHSDRAESEILKLIGAAGRIQWIRVWIEGVSDWIQKNPSQVKAPESFLPELNTHIKHWMDPQAAVSEDMLHENDSSDEIGG